MLNLSKLRKKIDEDPGSWPINLADLMTLLLCFFVMLFSISKLDQDRYAEVVKSLEASLGADKPREALPLGDLGIYRQTIAKPEEKQKPAPPPEPAPKPQPLELKKDIGQVKLELEARFAKEGQAVEVHARDAGLAVNLKGAAFFDPASAEITPQSLHFLESIAQILRGGHYKIVVEGHTDDRPIQSWLYPSNWELSAARASRVARYLIDKGLPAGNVQVAGYADTRPVAPNRDSLGAPLPENQARNRRVVVNILP